jgi:hypothetical protein
MKVTYSYEVEQEDIPVRGNAQASGDEEDDQSVESHIINELEAGNVWMWCWVKVTAEAEGYTGEDSLGCISCTSKKEFEATFYEEMKDEALRDLCNKMAQDAVRDGTEECVPYLGEDSEG